MPHEIEADIKILTLELSMQMIFILLCLHVYFDLNYSLDFNSLNHISLWTLRLL